MRFTTTLLALAAAGALAACGKAQEKASEKAAEKVIESQLSKDGGSAKVDLSGSAMKVQTTDASGKTTQMEMGGAKVGESDVGVPFYPGTKPLEGAATRIESPDGSMVSVGLHSDDAPDKVATFYREKLKAQAEGKQFTDMGGADGATALSLVDDKTGSALQVHIAKAEKGTDLQIVATRKGTK